MDPSSWVAISRAPWSFTDIHHLKSWLRSGNHIFKFSTPFPFSSEIAIALPDLTSFPAAPLFIMVFKQSLPPCFPWSKASRPSKPPWQLSSQLLKDLCFQCYRLIASKDCGSEQCFEYRAAFLLGCVGTQHRAVSQRCWLNNIHPTELGGGGFLSPLEEKLTSSI